MSFGIGAGDIIKASELAYKLWRACSSANSEFNELSRELSSIQILLRSLGDDADNPMSLLCRRGAGRQEELKTMIDNLNNALVEVERLIDKYKSLGLKKKRVFDRVKFATHDLSELRSTLAVHLEIISGFYNSLSSGSLAKIEQIVEDIYQEIITDRRPRTILSICSNPRDQSAWAALEEELVAEGVPMNKVEDNRSEIIAFLKSLMLQDPEGLTPSDSVSNDPVMQRQAMEDLMTLEKLRANDFFIDDQDALAVESEEAFIWAAGKGYLDVIKYLLRNEIDINVKDNDGGTALHQAARSGQTETVDFLLQSGARLDCLRNVKARDDVPKTFIKSTVLMDAVEHGRTATIKLLIASKVFLGPAEPGAATPLHIAVLNNRHSALRLVLKAGVDIEACSSDHNEFTALRIAVANGNVAMVQCLLASGASTSANETAKYKNKTLIHEVLDGPFEESRKLNLCQLFVNANVSVRAARPWNENRAPLSVAVSQGLITIVEFFLRCGADPDVIDSSKHCPLMLTVESRAKEDLKVSLIQRLHEAGADMNVICPMVFKFSSGEKMSALQRAVVTQQLVVVRHLIAAGADPNCRSSTSATPLTEAAQLQSRSESEMDIIKALVAAGADLTYVHPSGKQNLVHLAACAYNLEAVKFFISKGVSARSLNEDGDTPLMSAFRTRRYNSQSSTKISMIDVFRESGTSINDQHALSKETILHLAALCNDSETLEHLLKSGASANALDKRQANALHYAAHAKLHKNIAALLKAGVNPRQRMKVRESFVYPIDIVNYYEKKCGPMTDVLAVVSPPSSTKFWGFEWTPGRTPSEDVDD